MTLAIICICALIAFVIGVLLWWPNEPPDDPWDEDHFV